MRKAKSLNWLRAYLDDPQTGNKIPYIRLLKDSLYYGASATDYMIINRFVDYFNSFVYVDLETTYERIYEGFIKGKRVNSLSNQEREEHFRENFYDEYEYIEDYIPVHIQRFSFKDLDLNDFDIPFAPDAEYVDMDALRWLEEQPTEEFGLWVVLKKRNGYKLISLLFFNYDMNKMYYALYNKNHIRPKMLVFKNPGWGYWDRRTTDTGRTDDHGTYYKRVIRSNRAGIPNYYYSEIWSNSSDVDNTLKEYEDMSGDGFWAVKKYTKLHKNAEKILHRIGKVFFINNYNILKEQTTFPKRNVVGNIPLKQLENANILFEENLNMLALQNCAESMELTIEQRMEARRLIEEELNINR